MLSLLLTLSLTQCAPEQWGKNILCPNVQGQPAAFQFAPTGGRGVGAACPLPNWVYDSSQITTANWTTNNGVIAAPTRTSNFAPAPDGTLTADRVQIPASTGAQYSLIRQNTATPLSGTMTFSVYVMGNAGTSGTINILTFAGGAPCTPCTYNGTTWTRCTATNSYASGSIFYGNDTQDCGGTAPAADLLVWGHQLNVGSTATTYYATSAPPMGQPITGSKAEPLTFTRSTNGTCTAGNPTSGIQNGDLVIMPPNQPRIGNPDGAGVALLVESSRQNVVIQSQAFDNAAYANFTAGVGAAPTKNAANSTVAPDGTTTAETVTFNATGAADSSGLSQTVLTAAAWSGSVYAQGNATTPSGTFDLCLTNVPTAACVACSYVLGSWTRCIDANVASTVGGLWYVGNLSSLNGGTTRPTQTVTLWGSQAELGAYATSYIPTTTVAVTRAAERAIATLPTALPSTAGSHAATGIMEWTAVGQVSYLVTYGANASPLYQSSGVCTYDSTNQICQASTWTSGAAKRVWSSYTDSTQTVSDSVSTTTGAFDSSMLTTTSMDIGSQSGSFNVNGYVRQICADPSPTRCR